MCVCVCVAEMDNKDGGREIVNKSFFLMLFLFFKHQVSGSVSESIPFCFYNSQHQTLVSRTTSTPWFKRVIDVHHDNLLQCL